MTESFFDLKPGDQVILEDSDSSIVTIDRVTKTQIIIGERRFSRKIGYEICVDVNSYSCILRIATPELIAKVKNEEENRKAREHARALMREFREQCHRGDIIAALPHLEEAVNVLTSNQKVND